jgi:tRNA (cytidine/uridine-2'-O-)-methyltransferase
MQKPAPHYHIVLVRPDIAGNTGNAGRSCMALGCRLHLVHPLGYRITDANLKRAGMDYWPMLDLKEHDDLEAWMASLPESAPVFLLTTKAEQPWSAAEVPEGSILVFGSESAGLPPEVHARWRKQSRRIPMDARARSLNLSSSVAMVLGSLLLK